MSRNILIAMLAITTAVLVATPGVWADADFGDAPDPTYPSLAAPHPPTGLPGVYHLDVTQEWFGPPGTSTTTLEPDAFVPDGDMDDGNVEIIRTVLYGTPSTWGTLAFDVATDPMSAAGFRYINVAADLNGNGMWAAYLYDGANEQPEWIVQNVQIFLPPGEGFRLGLPFWFPDLAADTLPMIWVRVTISTEPIDPLPYGTAGWDGTGPLSGLMRGETEDWPLVVSVEDVSSMVDTAPFDLDKGAGTLSSAPSQSPVPSATAEGYLRGGMPDNNQGKNECAPTSATNSVQWLAQQGGFTNKLPAGGADGTKGELKKDMDPGYTSGEYGGIYPRNYLPGKNKFTKRHGLPIGTTTGGNFNGSGTFDFMKGELKAGSDVEMRIQYSPSGGHWVTVVGYSVDKDGNKRVYINDPLSPGNKAESYKVKADGTIEGYPYGTAKMSFAVAEKRVVWGTASNFDVLNNTGQAANDFEVVLGDVNHKKVKKTYTGFLGYGKAAATAEGTGTKITWTNGTTNPGQKSHFGYSLPKGVKPTSLQMTWTNNGTTIGSIPSVPQTFTTKTDGGMQITLRNDSDQMVEVQRSLAALTETVALDDLNRDNLELEAELLPIDPTPVTLLPDEELVYDIPELTVDTEAIVLAYGVDYNIDSFFDVFYYNEAFVYLPEPFSNVGEAKAVPDGTPVQIDMPTVVNQTLDYQIDSFFDVFFELDTRAAGLAVKSEGSDILPGDSIIVTGQMTTSGGMRILDADHIHIYSNDCDIPAPLAMPNRALGATGMFGTVALDNTGMQVRVTGSLVGPVMIPEDYLPLGYETYLIEDGSMTPVTIAIPEGLMLPPEAYVSVSGASCCWADMPWEEGNKMVIADDFEDVVIYSGGPM